MSTAVKLNFSEEVNELVYRKLGEMVTKKKKKVTISDAIQVLLKDAYLRKTDEQKL